ncbi:DNA-3-methyladenine glycosylase I [bacterium]|nr:DNA-3-methyladenine glycosylase I [bacterium]
MIPYHDKEWGVPLYDDQKLFECLVLDGFQAGLSWATILKKRSHFRRVFAQFDANKIAYFDEHRIRELLLDPGIIRNRLKIIATIKNARSFLSVQAKFGSFKNYIWQFTDGETIINTWKDASEVPTISEQAIAMSKDLRRRGFSFTGPTICYAFMQATGMVHDHTVDCFRYSEIIEKYHNVSA